MWKFMITAAFLLVLQADICVSLECSDCADSMKHRCFVNPCLGVECPSGQRCCTDYCWGCNHRCV
ncbi:Hypothetical predicted protein [Mytilus galloprovincialis]|uniref:Uncharacterized protein n=1 Tax=Mytilus galloprovincialis TaxID=29158 RepID=A0A8B6DRH4_MYTGA|nr:Hypothetical predicted protein [Mytilus galloprovincialis]